ncbi:MAG: metal-dependent hydrolase [Chloroflexi bacterium]|nr:metal-dependent hydrolase [Chloroflexota bacterium]
MTIVGHIGGSLLIASVVERGVFSRPAAPATLGLAVLVGLLPDADALLALALGRWRPRQAMLAHHRYPTHAPLFYALLALALWPLAGAEAALLFGALTLGHLLLDTWGTDDGIMWLWPVSRRQFAVWPIHPHTDLVFGWRYYWHYVRHWRAVAAEALLLVGGLAVALLP